MRTPDSDSNHHSDDDPILIITPKKDNSVIEIKYNSSSMRIQRSRIPVPLNKIKLTQSEPNSPKRVNSFKQYRSSPNLSQREQRSTQESVRSKIPTRRNLTDHHVEPKIKHAGVLERRSHTFQANTQSKLELPVIRKTPSPNILRNRSDSVLLPRDVSSSITERNNEKTSGLKTFLMTLPERRVTPTFDGIQSTSSSVDIANWYEFPHSDGNTSSSHDNNYSKQTSVRKLPHKNNSNKAPGMYSPIPVHNEIEVFHNLTRSPDRKRKGTTPGTDERYYVPLKRENKTSTRLIEQHVNYVSYKNQLENGDERNMLQDKCCVTSEQILNDMRDTTYEASDISQELYVPSKTDLDEMKYSKEVIGDVTPIIVTFPSDNPLEFNNRYNSFHVYNSNNPSIDFSDSPIPTKDSGDCLTCSSSGSEIMVLDSVRKPDGLLNSKIIRDIQCKVRVSKLYVIYLYITLFGFYIK